MEHSWDVYVSASEGPEDMNTPDFASWLSDQDLGGEVISGPSAGPRSAALVVKVSAPTQDEACALVLAKVKAHVGDAWIVGARPDDEA
ncbi:MAG: hypothetical protein ABI894_14280 [Ilumatobacteraceae bacterium]